MGSIDAVIFDMDGVLIDSERTWAEVRREFTLDHGGHWDEGTDRKMMGMSSPEWATFMHEDLGVPMSADEIVDAVVEEMTKRYRARVPVLPGAVDAVRRLAGRWPLGLASSANRPLIDLVLEETGLAAAFAETRSTEEVADGKPAPDVYLEVARLLDAEPARCAGVRTRPTASRRSPRPGCGSSPSPTRTSRPRPTSWRQPTP